MGKLRLNSKVLYRYIFSYVVVLSIPIIIIGGIVYQSFIETVEREVTNSNLNLLTQVRDTVDSQMAELQNISFHIAGNTDLTPYSATKNAFHEMNTIAQLRNYISANHFIHDLVLHYKGHDTLYSPFSTYDMDTFTTAIYTFENWKPERWRESLELTPSPFVYKTRDLQTGTSYIAYVTPVPPNDANPYGTAVYFIKEATLREMMRKEFEEDHGITLIVDERGDVVASSVPMAEATVRELLGQPRLPAHDDAAETVEWESRQYYTFTAVSEQLGWSYVTLLDREKVFRKVEEAKRQSLHALLLVLFVGSVVIFFVTQMNYRPIRSLRQLAESKLSGPIQGKNEFDSIQSALHVISEDKEQLSRTLHNHRPALKHFLILHCIQGRFADVEEFNARAEIAGLALQAYAFAVGIVRLSRPIDRTSPAAKEELVQRIEDRLNQHNMTVYGAESLDGRHIMLVLNARQGAAAYLPAQLQALQAELQQTLRLQTTIGVGTFYREMSELGKSYIEASVSLDYRLIAGNGKTILFTEIPLRQERIQQEAVAVDWQQLRSCIYQGDTVRIEELLKRTIVDIRNVQPPLFIVKCLCFDLINLILSIMKERRLDQGGDQTLYPDVVALTEFETVEELIDLVRSITLDLCTRISQRKESGNTDLVDKIKEYVDQQYGSYQLSLQSLAERLQMSPSYLSRYYKDQTGQTLSHYINQIRMEKAKSLLAEGTVSLQEIVDRIGYGSVSGFIRKFKELEGMTPGEYRSMRGKAM